MQKERVRFAPSPTGYLHIGGARTALYNWLWARKTGGTFVLRIEDTDQERSTAESLQAILDSMTWLGLDWDEGPGKGGDHGPYSQMERLAIYRDYADRMVREGTAYRCYATKDEIDAEKARQLASGAKAYRYPGWWRDKTEKDRPSDRPYVIRLKVPESGTTGWDDLVKGRIDFSNAELQDQVIMRSDGVPLYNFGCVIDDVTMEITLVARGDDHMINTPIQLLLYRALGVPAPKMAHLSMILGMDGKKMSKRHGEVSVELYRDQGYVADGLLNYLARLGWSHGDDEIFTRDELVQKFDWAHCSREGARWDPKKLAHVQSTHLRMLPKEKLAAEAAPFVAKSGLRVSPSDPRYVEACEIVKNRATLLADVADMVDYFFREPPTVDEKAVAKFLVPGVKENLQAFRDLIATVEPFERHAMEIAVNAWMEERKLAFKDYAQAVRVAVSGRSATPGLYEVLEVLGRELVLKRLDGAIARIG
ncbi:MAG: glutamate--tRNA ligase [Sandaracinaceae bacterium]|nr:glutamate--tRNA ligase [Sandaracinaceae bacterium]